MKLPETQVAVLEAVSADDPTPIDEIAEATGEKPEAVTRAAFELEDRGLVSVAERPETEYALTEEGEEYAYQGLPEHTLWVGALSKDAAEEPVELGKAIGPSGLEGDQVDIALSNLARKGMGTIDQGMISVDADFDLESDPERALLEELREDDATVDAEETDEEAVETLVSRGLLERYDFTVREVTLTDEGVTALMEGVETAETVGQVTPELLTTGEWDEVEFAEYNVEADAETVHGGKPHALRQLSERVKDVLVGMGFQEMQGPHVDADFYINDCLFMP
ncbi:MAG: phenylalanine--tRNA ligase subunit alpha, partial [Halosimplex sp.]